jgi:predicted DNA-binding transcriptional regulator AlpA
MEFEFGMKFKLGAGDSDMDALVERLGEAGCDDATVGIGQPGRIALEFAREARSAKQAIVSALKDVKRAIPDAELIEVTPDFVGLTDVAELVGVSRQNMRKLMLTHAATFPAPVHEGTTSVWHLAHVLQWLTGRGDYSIEGQLIEVASMAMQINLAKEARRLGGRVEREMRTLVAS